MNKILKYILKGKRDEFTVHIILSRLVILLIIAGFACLCASYLKGSREKKVARLLEEKYKTGENIVFFGYSTTLPRKLDAYLKTFSPEWFYKNTKPFHYRCDFVRFVNSELDDEDFKKLSCFKYLSLLDLDGVEITDLTPLEGLPIVNLTLKNNNLNDLTPLKGNDLKILDISNTSVKDLRPLEGMKVEILSLDNTPVTDLSPLKRTSIKNLSLKGCKGLNDFTPLAGTPLEILDLSNTHANEISFLKGMKLESLDLSNTKIIDISPLEDMPLLKLNLGHCSLLKDLTPLMACKNLRELILPDEVEDIEFLKGHPGIERLKRASDPREMRFADDFWREYYIKNSE